MKSQHRDGIRALPWAGAALTLACLLGIPNVSSARTYVPHGPPYPDGDPTADDQPSPTPKQTRSMNQVQKVPGSDTTKVGAITNARLIWLSYVRVWIRITLR